jgi:hypothetical protein
MNRRWSRFVTAAALILMIALVAVVTLTGNR